MPAAQLLHRQIGGEHQRRGEGIRIDVQHTVGASPSGHLDDPVDHAFYLERYELSRAPGRSPFNDQLYATRNLDEGVLAYLGATRFWKRPEGVAKRELSPDELAESLEAELGLSREMVERLRAAGRLG